jgi:hypothetical protein
MDEIEFLRKMKLHDRTQLLFGILYLGNRPLPVDDLQPLITYQKAKEHKRISLETLVEELNGELKSRSAPYSVQWRYNKESLELTLNQEYVKDLSFSEHFFKQENIPREKLKIISFITFKNYFEHSPCYSHDLLLNKTFNCDEIKLANILYELEQKDGLIYQNKSSNGKVELKLTNQFFDMMHLPKDILQLGPILRNQLLRVIDGENTDSLDIDEQEDELEL